MAVFFAPGLRADRKRHSRRQFRASFRLSLIRLRWPQAFCAVAEQRRADADARGAFLQSATEKSPLMPIESTSRRKPRMRRGPAVAPLAQAAKTGTRYVLGNAPRRDRHQAARVQILEIRQALKQLRRFRGLRLKARLWSLPD